MLSLKHLDDFITALADYHISDHAKQLLADRPVVTLTAITATGRNTMIYELVKTGQYYFLVSDTTRPPRQNNGKMERSGVEYWFRSEEEVLADLRVGKYVAPAIIHQQQVSGIGIRELEAALSQNKIAITEIETKGVEETLSQAPGSLVPIFVVPPSYKEWMQRWTNRGPISVEEKQHRLASARRELTTALNNEFYKFVINDNLVQAVHDVRQVVAGKFNFDQDAAARAVAGDILQKISV